MKHKRIPKPRCIDCEFRLAYYDDSIKYTEGIMPEYGKHYCSFGKRFREFRKKDPKIYPPSWCPKRKMPSEFCIYDFKDSEAWLLNRMVKNSSAPPSYRCAVRRSGTTSLSPGEFYREALTSDVSALLEVEVKSGEVVEIDDGLIPYCFYIKHHSVEVLTHWCPEKARRNIYTWSTSVD